MALTRSADLDPRRVYLRWKSIHGEIVSRPGGFTSEEAIFTE